MKIHASEPARDGGTKSRRAARNPVWRIVRVFLLAILVVHAVYIGLTGTLILIYKFANPPTTTLMIYRSLFDHWKVQKPIPLKIAQTPSYIRRMLVSVEDGKFYEHHGIDLEAIRRARELNKKIGRPMYGGSTLTQQVARTLFLVPDKSYVRKYFEAITALELELILSKNRILELYFGYAEWGKGIFGIERASRVYYGTGIAGIQVDQAARLIALLSSPIKYKPDTIYRSLILRERYEYLVRRYVAPVVEPETTAETPPPAGLEPSTDVAAEDLSPTTLDDLSAPADASSSEQSGGDEESQQPSAPAAGEAPAKESPKDSFRDVPMDAAEQGAAQKLRSPSEGASSNMGATNASP